MEEPQAAEVPAQKPVLPQVAEASAHSLSGSVSTGIVVQVPLTPPDLAAAQAWQVPLQAVLQQKPSMQLPSVHWWLPVASMVSEAQAWAALEAFF